MRDNNFHPSFQFCTNEKPQMSLGDFAVESDSNNDSQDEKLNNILKEDYDAFPKENTISSVNISNSIPNIHIPFTKKDNANERYFNNKIDDFNMNKRSTFSKENNRYSNIHEMYNNNLRFLSICESDYHEEDDDIVNFVNSEIHSQMDSNKSTHYIKEFNTYYNIENDDQIEVEIQPDISKLISAEIDENKIPKDIINDNVKNDKNNEEMKNCDKNIIIKDNNIIRNIDINNSVDSSSFSSKSVLRDSKKFFELNSKVKKKAMTILNLSIQNKIFQKFLSVSVDTSGLYSLEDEMPILLLNPKIIYNYPFNKMERELE